MIPTLNHIQLTHDLNFGTDVEYCYFPMLVTIQLLNPYDSNLDQY